ncbi:PREDICTED: uncharacterized protein LOC106316997 [Brassica oleracea var. oleracea]|uniref:uncharacterized protein LOC106316997 n=1 Tax=Brassica oleracea var. oleracea TaxID=109376 RepID=UPI0006A71C18|nr:PREDICTED: uncharacterized protein LOC106316997 [Brassica oleracea var. oleracea]XP_013610317.1 PREDICTED: uncharacterized protein LOC106316997 [Brassica oleracea var. oleracea]
MVMTISCSNESMFPPYENDFEAIEEQFMSRCGVKPTLDHHRVWREENRVSVEEVWKEHYILQWNAGSLEPWRGTEEYFELVTKKGAHHADLRAATKRRSGVAERAEEARGGHYRKVDQ